MPVKDPEKRKEINQRYSKTDKGIKSNHVKKWRSRGVKCDDWDALHERYINTTHCDNCNIELVSGIYGANKKVLDHSHKTGEFRNVLCNTCNLLRGK